MKTLANSTDVALSFHHSKLLLDGTLEFCTHRIKDGDTSHKVHGHYFRSFDEAWADYNKRKKKFNN